MKAFILIACILYSVSCWSQTEKRASYGDKLEMEMEPYHPENPDRSSGPHSLPQHPYIIILNQTGIHFKLTIFYTETSIEQIDINGSDTKKLTRNTTCTYVLRGENQPHSDTRTCDSGKTYSIVWDASSNKYCLRVN